MRVRAGLHHAVFFLAKLVLCFGLISWQSLQAQNGRVTGVITESGSNAVLPGANVTLMGTALGASSDGKGRFQLTRVPAGTHTLQVRYLGYKTASAQITVQDDQTVTQNFALAIETLPGKEVTVWGVRAKSQAEALNKQMNAVNILNVVASDQMGKFPDATAPDAIQRLPGVAVTRDQGEARYIQIRGGSPQMTAVLFNGESVPSPEGDVRQIALDAVPMDVLESIEVAKAITPDMDADAIGGMVNLVTKRAPERGLFTFEAAGGYASIREEFGGSGALTFGRRTADGRFGYLFNGSYYRRNFGSDDLEPEYALNEDGLDDDELDNLDVRHYLLRRNRFGGTLNLDYRLDPNSTLYLTGIYSELQDDEDRLRLRHLVSDNELAFVHKTRLEKLTTMNFTAGGDHLFEKDLRLDYHLTYAQSGEDTPNDDEIFFTQGDVAFNPDISAADNIQANPAPGTIDGIYPFDGIEPANSKTENTDYVGALNLAVPFNFSGQSSGSLKFGGKYRHKFKDQDVTEMEYGLIDGANDVVLGQDIGEPFSNEGYNPGDYPFPPYATTADEVKGFVNKYSATLAGGKVLEGDVNDYEVTENTIAAYALTELNFSPTFTLLPGLRFERTSVNADAFDFDPDTETLSPTKNEKSYSKFFPMLHARYRVAPRSNLRAAVTRALVRPNFYDLVPYRLRDGEDFALGNTELDPTTSWNADLMFEHYNQLIGVISAGVFSKWLSDPIFIFTTANSLGGETSQPQNGESGTIRGFEVALQQQLKTLPGVLSGLGIYANYTFTDSDARLPDGREARFPGQAQHVVNAALSYEKGGFSGQLSLNFIDDFVDEFGGNVGDRAEDMFIDDRTQFDFSASYRFSSPFSIFAEVNNLTNQPFRLYQGFDVRPRQDEYYERWGRLGLRYSL